MNFRKVHSELEKHLLDYSAEIGDERMLDTIEQEQLLHYGANGPNEDNPQGIRGWSLAHDENPRYKDFTATKPNPKRRRDQRIDESVTPASPLAYLIPHQILSRIATRTFLETLGPRAQSALDAYENTPADENIPIAEGGASVIDKLGSLMLAGESTFIAVAHAESLDDVGINQGPIAIAATRKKSSLIQKIGTSLSKTLSLEEYKGKSITDRFKFFGKIYWTLPESENLSKYNIPDDIVKRVQDGGSRAMMRDAENGTSVVIAPAGSGMKILPQDENGNITIGPNILDMPEIPEGTLVLLSKFRHYVVAAAWGDKVGVSSIFHLPDYAEAAKARTPAGEKVKKLSIKERKQATVEHLNRISHELAQLTANLSEMPVRHRVIERLGEQAVSRLVFPSQKELT